MGICLNMIVRNESKNLPRLFASLAGVVDYYVISDTGSTDDTIRQVGVWGERYHIPGEVTEHAWVDFAHNRNLAMADAIAARLAGRHQCQWLMMIDADEELVCADLRWKSSLDIGRSYYMYKKTSAAAWAHLCLVWIEGQQWHWQGRVHNYLINENDGHLKDFLLDPFIRYHVFEGSKSAEFSTLREKALRDIRLLEEELRDEPVSIRNLHRYAQLASSLALAREDDRALDIMRQVVDSGLGSVARQYSARIFLAEYLARQSGAASEAIRYLDEAIRLDPSRKEALFYKALLLRKTGRAGEALALLEHAAALPWPSQGYFMWEEPVYAWRIDRELAFLYYQLGDVESASACIRKLNKVKDLPDAERAFISSLAQRLAGKMEDTIKKDTGQ
jgi:tetratricopeptide (TPR) repeat protein